VQVVLIGANARTIGHIDRIRRIVLLLGVVVDKSVTFLYVSFLNNR
jgi:hypothetical protein